MDWVWGGGQSGFGMS